MNFTLLGTNKTDDGLREMRVRSADKGEGGPKIQKFCRFHEEKYDPYFCIIMHFIPCMDSPSGGGWYFWTGAAAAGFGSDASPAVAISGALQATFAM